MDRRFRGLMAHITIEYVILLPILLIQVILFPVFVGWTMNIWIDSRRTLALEEIAGYVGSTIQQLYLTLSCDKSAAGVNIKNELGIPPYIEGSAYSGSAVLLQGSSPESSKVLRLTIKLENSKVEVEYSVLLGLDTAWNETSVFISNKNPCIVAERDAETGIVKLYFINAAEG